MSSPSPKSDKALQFIADIKLAEVDKQRLRYQEMAKTLFASHGKDKADDDDKERLLQKIELLIAAVTEWKGPGQLEGTSIGDGGKLDLENLRSWMDQARKEVGFDLKVVKRWEETLVAHIHQTSARFDAAMLSWQMYHEWMDSEDIKVVSQPLKEAGEIEVEDVEEGFDMMLDAPTPGVQHISTPEMKKIQERERILSIVGEEYPTDAERLTTYLDALYGSDDAKLALSRVRASLYNFGSSFSMPKVDRHDIRQAISALLTMRTMEENENATLREIHSSDAAVQEVADVIQMRFVDLKSWKWQKGGHIAPKDSSGILSAFADPHIIDSILWEYIGNQWRQEVQSALWNMFESHAWKRAKVSAEQSNAMDKIESLYPSDSISRKREKMRSRYFFLPNLNNPAAAPAINCDLAEMNQREQDNPTRSSAVSRRVLLHLMATECRLNNALHGSHTMVQVELEDLEHSVSHQSILIVLAYLGVPEDWILAFHSFLAMPVSADSATPRVCKRGTPIGYTLSVVLREAVLHIMDFAVNQRAEGLFLYRFGRHADLSFWDADAELCSKAQRQMEEYASLVGIRLQVQKVGTSRQAASENPPIPMGDIKWGFLRFDAAQVGFVIDQGEVDLQITEFRKHLASTKSIIGWVEVYNKYMGHFWRNFGSVPAECLGDEFVDDMIATFTRIHRELFAEPGTGPVGYLRKIISERFGVEELPDGYFYLPFSSGGLELNNVILSLTSLGRENGPSPGSYMVLRQAERSNAPSVPSNAQYSPAASRFTTQFFDDLNDYTALVSRWKIIECGPGKSGKSMPVEQGFISFGEYAALRECYLMSWGKVFDSMFQNLRVKAASTPLGVGRLSSFSTRSGFTAARWRSIESYYSKRVVSIYGEEVIKRFGTVNIVDKLLLPTHVFRT